MGYNPIDQMDLANMPTNSSHALIYWHQRILIESFKSNYYGYIEVY
jgi:hypothetical protein